MILYFFFFQAEDGIRDLTVTGVQTCALPISLDTNAGASGSDRRTTTRRWRPSNQAATRSCFSRSRSSETKTRFCEKSSRPLESKRSEEHTSELQSQSNLVCRLLLEKKKLTQQIVRHELHVSRTQT